MPPEDGRVGWRGGMPASEWHPLLRGGGCYVGREAYVVPFQLNDEVAQRIPVFGVGAVSEEWVRGKAL